jgi:YggT family protein
MGNPYLSNAGVFLVSAVFGLFVLAVMLRMLLAWVRADFYNPVSQFLVTVTNPLLIPLRRLIPPLGAVDLAAVVLLALLELGKLVLIRLIAGAALSLDALVLLSIAELLGTLLNIFLFTIIVQVVLSWLAPRTYHPVTALLYQLNEPLLAPARRLIPPISGLDLSPLLVIVAIQLLKMLLVAPLTDMGWAAAAT